MPGSTGLAVRVGSLGLGERHDRLRRLPLHRAKGNLGQEVKVIVFEERLHAGSPP